jgi:alkylation response protein AidB-like acyl-CoA dehydrogenase
MDLTLTGEQQSVREAFGDFFAKESTPARVRAAEPLGFDPALWQSLAQTGAVVMGTPEDLGGGGATRLDQVLVAQEYGRRLAPVPFPEAVTAADLLSQVPAGQKFLTGIADGSLVPSFTPRPAVAGTARLAPAGAVADLLVALDGDELVAALGSPAAGTADPGAGNNGSFRKNLGSMPLADWDLRRADAVRVVLARGTRARELHAAGCALWQLLTGAALDGLRAEALRMGVAYVKERRAFGVPIGQFQAIQHRLADVAAAGEGLGLLVYEAGWAADARPSAEAAALAGMALLAAAEIAFRTCREALQFHGGYGYTLEYDIQLYFRRAKAWPLAGGPIGDQYQRLAGQLFGGGE